MTDCTIKRMYYMDFMSFFALRRVFVEQSLIIRLADYMWDNSIKLRDIESYSGTRNHIKIKFQDRSIFLTTVTDEITVDL